MMPVPAHAATQSRALWILAILACLAFLKLAAELLIPAAVSVLAALALAPIVAWLERWRVPRAVGAGLVLLVLVGGAAWGSYAAKERLTSAVEALPSVVRQVRAMVEETLSSAHFERASQELNGSKGGTGGGAATPAAAPMAQRLAQALVAAAGHITVVVFFVYFLLQSGPAMSTRVVALSDTAERRRATARILRDINTQVQRFLLVQAFTAAVVAVATWGVLAWMGVGSAVLWGVLAGLLNSIPYFGPVVVSGGMFVVGLVQEGSAMRAWQMAGAALAVTSLEGWLLTPPLMGRAERMNVLSVFVGLLLWTWLWGAWGTLLAVPMLSVLKSIADHVEALRPLGRLMAR